MVHVIYFLNTEFSRRDGYEVLQCLITEDMEHYMQYNYENFFVWPKWLNALMQLRTQDPGYENQSYLSVSFAIKLSST